jgi:VWFA-related protein
VIKTLSEEVLLDMVARDRHGKPIRDLTQDQIEVFEDGVKQQITSFRFVEGEGPVTTAMEGGKPSPTQPAVALGQVNLVSLVFERLGEEGRIHASEAARAFLKSELRPNVYVAVFTNDKALFVLQQFTNNRQILEKAVDMATRATSSQMAAQSASVVEELEIVTKAAEDASVAAGAAAAGVSSGSRGSGAAGMGAAMAEAQMAQMTLDMIQRDTVLTREQEGRSSLYALLSLVKEQRRLPGRKTIIYFSQGLNVTPALVGLLEATISEANRSNVSVYSVDARGLVLSEVSGSQHENMLGAESAVRINARPERDNTRVFDRVGGEELYEIQARANVQDTLADLSRSTGGFLIANTNEMEPAMRRIAEDIRGYYTVAYRPSTHEYDNEFHHITVKVLRSGINLQTRDGYMAAPPVGGSPVLPYEVPMLSALKSSPQAKGPHYEAQALHFGYTPDGLHCHLVIKVPLSDMNFKPNTDKNQSGTHFSVLTLVEGSDGNPLLKFSQDYPLEGPTEKLEALKKATVLFARDFTLHTGRYSLDTVVLDQDGQKASVQRSVLIIPPQTQGVRLSSLAIIQRLDPLPPPDQGNHDPLRLPNAEIIPNFGEPIQLGASAGVPLYFVVYPTTQVPEKPQVELEISRGGMVIARAPVQLPEPDSTGAIRYVGTLPVAKFEPGRYQIRALARQGSAAAEEYAFFSLKP